MTERELSDLPNEPGGSMSLLLENWSENESEIAERIAREYFPRLRRFAQRVLRGFSGAAAEADDVVQSAIKSLCLFMRRQSNTQDKDRDDVWRLLCHIVARKAARRRQRQTRGLRGGRVRPLSDFADGEDQLPIEAVLHEIPPQEFDAIVHEAVERLDASLQPIALMVMEGRTQSEISEILGCSRRTVIRKFDLVKRLLASYLE